MCGIAGIHVKERYKGTLPLNDMLDYLLVHIAERGKDATGFVSVHFGGKGVTLSKKDVPAVEFIGVRARPNMAHVQTILGHTRFATQGPQEKAENNHPVVFNSCFATHNGHIYNDDEVVEEFDLKGSRPAEVDSIAIPIALASCGMENIEQIKQGLEKLQGNMAVAAIDPVKHPGRVVLAKGNSSPLFVLNHRTGFYWASTRAAIEFMWGHLIGTPPTNVAKNPSQRGWYEFKWGEGWIIEGDEAAPFKFNPAYRQSNYTGNYNSNWNRGGSSDGGGFRGGSATPASTIRKVTRWLCRPSGKECVNPCDQGCLGTRCACRETVWVYRDVEYRFDPAHIEQYDREQERKGLTVLPNHCETPYRCFHGGRCQCDPPASGVSCSTPIFCGKREQCHCYGGGRSTTGESDSGTSGDSDGDDTGTGTDGGRLVLTDGKLRCDSCWEWYNQANLIPVPFGAVTYDLCADCAIEEGWGSVKRDDDETSQAHSVIPDESGDPDPVLDHYQAVAEAANQAHKEACNKTAEVLECKPDFVEWVLFKATLDELEEGGETLRELRKAVEDEYQLHYDEGVGV